MSGPPQDEPRVILQAKPDTSGIRSTAGGPDTGGVRVPKAQRTRGPQLHRNPKPPVAGNADEITSRHRTTPTPGNRDVVSSAFLITLQRKVF